MPIRLTVQEQRGWTVVAVAGVVDVATAPDLRQSLQEAQFGGADRVVVDLDQVELLDSFGLGVLLEAVKRARSQGGELAVVVTRERLRQVFTAAGLEETVRVVGGRDEVLDA